MNIAILGYGKEGKAVENYFKNEEIKVFDNFTDKELKSLDLSSFDLVFRSPSVKPFGENWTSVTKYFFDNCICPIIGVTGTKGKGTTSSIIAKILENLGKTVHLVGNIGNPSIDVLDKITPNDIVVYEMSSFQLWDLTVSPKIAVVLRIEPDHLNVHKDFDDYVSAKGHIAEFQSESDSCVFFKNNEKSREIAEKSKGKKFSYPIDKKSEQLTSLLNSLGIPGAHNRENAEAALLAVAALFETPLETFISENFDNLKSALESFKGLPHRLEFVREKDGIKFYDDNFSTTLPSLEVALKAFPTENLVLVAGGRDKTDGKIFPEISKLLENTENLKKVVLIGESGHTLFEKFPSEKFILAESLEEAVNLAEKSAKETSCSVVLMSPAAASFDMFENVYDRGDKYQTLIKNL